VFRVWVTEIRPVLLHKAGVCAGVSDSPEVSGLCVLLAQLDVKVTKTDDTWKLDRNITGDKVIEDRRPMLLHTRLLQEWMLFGCYGALKPDTHTFATLNVKLPDKILLWVHYPVLLNIQAGYIQIKINGANVSPVSIVNFPNTNAFEISLPSPPDEKSVLKVGFDVTKVTVKSGPDSGKPLVEVLHKLDYIYLDREGDWLWSYCIVAIPQLDDLADVDVPAPGNDQILTWDSGTGKWIATAKPVVINDHGALSGLTDDDHPQYLKETEAAVLYAPIVHNHPLNKLSDVDIAGLDGGNVLKWESVQQKWFPGPLPSGGLSLDEIAAQLPLLPFVTIRDTGITVENGVVFLFFQLWFHLDTGESVAPKLSNIDVSVYNEDLAKKCTVKKLEYKDLAELKGKCNVYNLSLNVSDIAKTDFNAIYLRFVFDLQNTTYKEGSNNPPLIKWINERPLKWIGHDGEKAITAFHHIFKTDILQNQYVIVAAGRFNPDGKAAAPTFNNLTAARLVDAKRNLFRLNFTGYDPAKNYIVKGTPLAKVGQGLLFTFVVNSVSNPSDNGIIVEATFEPSGKPPEGFMVEINEIL